MTGDAPEKREVTMAERLEKLVAASKRFNFDFSAELDEGDTLTGAATVTATPNGLTLGTPILGSGNTKVQVRISGGTDGATYVVHCVVPTTEGDTLAGCGKLKVKEC